MEIGLKIRLPHRGTDQLHAYFEINRDEHAHFEINRDEAGPSYWVCNLWISKYQVSAECTFRLRSDDVPVTQVYTGKLTQYTGGP